MAKLYDTSTMGKNTSAGDLSILDALDQQIQKGATGSAAVTAAKQSQAADQAAAKAKQDANNAKMKAELEAANKKSTSGGLTTVAGTTLHNVYGQDDPDNYYLSDPLSHTKGAVGAANTSRFYNHNYPYDNEPINPVPVANPGDLSALDAYDKIADQRAKGVSNPGSAEELARLDAIDAQLNAGNPAWQGVGYQPRNPEPETDTPITGGNGGNGGNTGGNTGVTVNTNITNQNPPTPAPAPSVIGPTGGQPAVEPAPVAVSPVVEAAAAEAAAEVVGPYGSHSHEIAATETPDIQREIEEILQAEYDKYGELTQQQIAYATQKAVNDLQRQLEDAAPTYNAERAKLAANQLNARDNLALKQVTEGVNGGIAAKQYSDQEAAYDSQMLNINLQQIQLSTDIGRQVADLEAQGDYETAKALLEVGITKLQELQDAKQNYQSLRINQAQILDDYDMASEQNVYNRAWSRLQAGLFNAGDAQALGVDPTQAQQFSDYVNTMRQLDAEQARLAIEQLVLKNEATRVDIDNARTAAARAAAGNGAGSSGTGAEATPYSGVMTSYEWNVYQSGLQGEGIPVYDSTGKQVALFSIGANGQPTVDLSKHPDWFINLSGRPLYWDDKAGDFVGAEAQQASIEQASQNSKEREWFARYLQELDESGNMGVSPTASTPIEARLDLEKRIKDLKTTLDYLASIRYGAGLYSEREAAAKSWRETNAQMGRLQALLNAYPKSERVVLS